MPWLAIPFEDRDAPETLMDKYGVHGIPSLILVDGATGKTITKEGRGKMTKDGAKGYPWK